MIRGVVEQALFLQRTDLEVMVVCHRRPRAAEGKDEVDEGGMAQVGDEAEVHRLNVISAVRNIGTAMNTVLRIGLKVWLMFLGEVLHARRVSDLLVGLQA